MEIGLMRGTYKLTKEEKIKYTDIITTAIEILSENQDNEISLCHLDIAPCQVDDILQSLGWNSIDHDINGWEGDSWWYYDNKNYVFGLTMFFCGWSFELKIHRSDIDD